MPSQGTHLIAANLSIKELAVRCFITAYVGRIAIIFAEKTSKVIGL